MLPVQLAAVRARVEAGASLDEATIEEIGFTYDRLAAAVSQHWRLSPYLTSLWSSDSDPAELTQFARFGRDLTRLMCLRAAEHQAPGLKLLVMKYSLPLRVTAEGIADVWERAVEDTRATFANLGVASWSLGAPLQYCRNVRLKRPARPNIAGAVPGTTRVIP